MYSNVKFLTLTMMCGILVFAGFACSSTEMNKFVSPEREPAVAINPGDVVSEDAKVVAIESMRLKDKVLAREISVKFTDSITDSQREKILDKYDLSVMRVIPELGFYRLKLKDGVTLTGELANLWDEELVEVAEPIYRTYAKQIRVEPNDPRFGEQAYLEHINAPEAWFVEPGSDMGAIPEQSDVLVAVLDTGLDMNHPDIMINVGAYDEVKIISGWNFIDGNGDVSDGHGHGTLVTGIIGALTSNNQGIAGTAWNPRIMPIKILDNNGTSDSFLSAEGIMFALGRFKDVSGEDRNFGYPIETIFNDPFNAKLIINMSYGYTVSNVLGEPQAEFSAIQAAYDSVDVLCVAAAGDDGVSINNGSESVYPAANPHVIKVGSIDYANNTLANSNIPSTVESLETQPFVVAPGYNILSTYPTAFSEGYSVGNGTSFAAAQVSGLIGLVWSQFPFLRPEEVLDILKETSNFDIVGVAGIDDQTGWGLIDCLAALQRSYQPQPINEPIIVEAFTNPILHGDIIFVIKSRYRLMDPVESPVYYEFFDDEGNLLDPPIIIYPNDGRAISYLVGYDTDNDDVIDQEFVIDVTPSGEPLYYPNELSLIQFADDLYIGRLHLHQDSPPQQGTLMIQFTGVPMNFRQDPEIPMTVTGSKKIEINGFNHS